MGGEGADYPQLSSRWGTNKQWQEEGHCRPSNPLPLPSLLWMRTSKEQGLNVLLWGGLNDNDNKTVDLAQLSIEGTSMANDDAHHHHSAGTDVNNKTQSFPASAPSGSDDNDNRMIKYKTKRRRSEEEVVPASAKEGGAEEEKGNKQGGGGRGLTAEEEHLLMQPSTADEWADDDGRQCLPFCCGPGRWLQ